MKRGLVYFSDKLQSSSVKFSGSWSPENPIGLTETTLKTFRVPWARKDRARGRCIFDQKSGKSRFKVENTLKTVFVSVWVNYPAYFHL